MIHQRKILKAIAYAILLCFTSLTGAQPLFAAPPNTQLPTGPGGGYNPTTHVGNVNAPVVVNDGSVMNIHQNSQTAVNEWGNFSIGADATVNFSGPEKFNSFNYVKNGGPISEIYGQLNATNNGNIFIANPAGVQIGNSAQINVGSLYITNKEFDVEEIKKKLSAESKTSDITGYIAGIAPNTNPAAELMSLGSITSATNVTFDGGRIVLDVDRFFTEEDGGGKVQMTPEQLKGAGGKAGSLVIKTNDKDNVVLGYTGYVENEQGEANYSEKGTFDGFKVTVTGVDEDGNVTETPNQTIAHGYMWIEDLDQLQKIAENDNLDGWYALRNSIDANYTSSNSYNSGLDNGATGPGFKPIGTYTQQGQDYVYNYDNAFTGRFDGLGYSLFGLNIKRENENGVGLFGAVHGEDAVVRNLILNGGSIAGGDNVGSVAGRVAGGARIEKITNTADVSGNKNSGGIAGALESKDDAVTSVTDLVNIGTVIGHENVGGIIGYAEGIDLKGTVYNLGGVTGKDDGQTYSNKIGGLIGEAYNSTIGDGTNLIYNRAGVTGGYDVGGIAGYVHGYRNTITNAANYGDVTATGFTETTYSYHTTADKDKLPHSPTIATDETGGTFATVSGVHAANAGGIAGRADGETDENDKQMSLEFTDVYNYGDVVSNTAEGESYRIAGNIGGIVGSATHTNITNAENSENIVAGAHNVGGIAGYLRGNSKIGSSGNDGGMITATGARNADGYVKEQVSQPNTGENADDEVAVIGNIGGIVGYLYASGQDTKITNSGNRGTVRSDSAANAGGVVGKADTADNNDDLFNQIKKDTSLATISNSYNTGEVQGYTGVGGIAGQMYLGSLAGSYNFGKLSATRQAHEGSLDPLNMGGIVGDTTTMTEGGGTVIYDVYNAGQIGDETFKYYGRHVGGVVGRLSGDIEKAYNIGDIYNGYSTVGGIAGWWVGGNIKNVFNTGNITVVNNDNETAGGERQSSQVGGIVGAYGGNDAELSYAYNLGTIRSFNVLLSDSATRTENSVGGIVGRIRGNGLYINNVYTTNNIYAATRTNSQEMPYAPNISDFVGAIYGVNEGSESSFANAYFVKLYDGDTFSQVGQDGSMKLNTYGVTKIIEAANNVADAYNRESYKSEDGSASFIFKDISEAGDSSWRIYDGKTLPILNAFTPDAAKNETKWSDSLSTNAVIQYGTAANPLLTIIDVTNVTDADGKNITLNGQTLGLHGAGSLAVYGNSGLTLTDFGVTLGSHYNGTVYSDGALTITTSDTEGALYNLGSGSRLYGSSVTFDAQGEAGTADDKDAALYGKITATNGGVNIKGKNVTVLGELTSSAANTTITGIAGTLDTNAMDFSNINNLDAPVSTVGDAYATKVTNDTAVEDRNVTIEASSVAEVLFSSMGGGKITTGGDLSVTGDQGIFVDSDFHIGKNMTLTSRVENDDGTVTGGEVVLDLSNMGKTSSGEDESDVEHMHKYFLDHFKKDEDGRSAGKITVDVANDEDFIIGLDMWDESKGTFNFTKYDVKNQDDGDHTLHEDIEHLNLTIKVNGAEGEHSSYRNHVFTWIESAAHLKAIYEYHKPQDDEDDDIYSYNFALKDDIDASQLSGYTPIASDTGEEYNGIFDGRGFRIIGLNANLNDNGTERGENDAHSRAGIFGTIGDEGKVRDLSVYDSKFTGQAAAGAIAGVNKGEIKDAVTFGNEVKVLGTQEAVKVAAGENDTATGDISISAAGGVAGVNLGAITGSDRTDASGIGSTHASDTVIAGGSTNTIFSAAGGVAGVNAAEDGSKGRIEKVSSTSAVRSNNIDNNGATKTHGLGGVAGINDGTITGAEAHGTTNTLFGLRSDGEAWDENVGGITGVNYGALDGVYNESAVAGKTNVGGVVGKNEIRGGTQATINNAVNAGPVFSRGGGDEATNAGGIAGANYGEITGGRNTDEITGNKNVGGVVGLNALGALLQNISNAIAAEIRGTENVGGIAGTNEADIVIADNLTNEGLIEGTKNVGGVVGVNEEGATIENPNSDVTLTAVGENPTNFGGVAGTNKGTITNATNRGTITAYGAQNVGGIVGVNEESGLLNNAGNKGTVIGGKHVAGVAGVNHSTNPEGRIENSGTVIATAGGAAGIIYGNTADLGGEGKTLELINSGTVVGFSQTPDHGTGGVIGVNSGNIANASLISTVESAVTGGWNTGGLIGYNTGEITGGRADNETNGLGYYAYKIYNNGEVTGTQNVGGLIGNNAADGKLIAGYNTGRVTGMKHDALEVTEDNITLPEGTELPKDVEISWPLTDTLEGGGEGENVGGIAGTNAGLLDQIFNFVMMKDKDDKVSGVSNAGGVVGSNEQGGEVKNAYNATAVEATGNGVKGNVAGTNDGIIENVYATNADGNLIGSNNSVTVTNAYTFIADDTAQGAKVVSGGAQNQAASYGGFGFTGTDSEKAVWKIYEGYGAPLLKVFLTEARYDGETGLMQTGGPLGLPISGVTAGDGLEAYRADNSLLVALKNSGVGDGYIAFASKQIAWSGTGDGFNPNWLGYDIDAVYDITPNPALLLTQNNGHLHWLHRGGDRNRSFRERKAEIYFHEGGMVHE